jgi:hypothetical protein
MTKQSTSTQGGKRLGAGRPAKNIPTVTLSFRVPLAVADKVKEKVKQLLQELKD